jgi:hypothetical protein
MFNQVFDVIQAICLTMMSAAFMAVYMAINLFESIYKKDCVHDNGKVVATEKFKSSMNNNVRSKRLMYRPIVQFIYQGQEYFFKGNVGRNVIKYKIGEQVQVQYLNGKPESVRIAGGKVLTRFGTLFGLIGLVVLCISVMTNSYLIEIKLLLAIAPFSILYLAYQFVSKKLIKAGGVDKLMSDNSPLRTREELNALDLLWNDQAVFKEEYRVHKPFLYILPILLGLVAWPASIIGPKFFKRPYVAENFNESLFDLDNLKIFVTTVMGQSEMKKEFLILGICLFFFLALTHSLIYTLRKTQ